MLMPITYAEKKFFSKHSREIAFELVKFSSFDNSVLLFKVLAHAVKNNDSIIQLLDESIFENEELFKEQFSSLLEHALLQATSQEAVAISVNKPAVHSEPIKEYTPRELSKYFGVSVVTIHNWMDQGRFADIQRAKGNKHNFIPEDAEYLSPSGKRIVIKDIIEMWHQQESDGNQTSGESDYGYYTRQIAMYEQKYGGEYKLTLGAKDILNPEEETDAQVWQHFLRRRQIEPGYSKE